MSPRMLLALVSVIVLGTMPPRSVSAQSSRPGIGATLFDDAEGYGTTFRTWAPNADSVSVVGSFNGFNPNTHFLGSEEGGWWSIDVPYVSQGARYKFVIRNDGQELWRVDPCAFDVTNSVGDSRVYDNGAYEWQVNDFQMPGWNELVIYEMHLGTFAAEPGGPANGTFLKAIDRLDYLQSLGINAIELMPHMEFPGDRSWGYNPAHLYAVESSYGSEDDLKAFIDEAYWTIELA